MYLFLERGEGKEKEGENHQCVVVSRASPTGDLAHNPSTCPLTGNLTATLRFAGPSSIH